MEMLKRSGEASLSIWLETLSYLLTMVQMQALIVSSGGNLMHSMC